MKTLLMALLFATTTPAFAAPLFCTTNLDRNPHKSGTYITVTAVKADVVKILMETRGGVTNFAAGPRTFLAKMLNMGPNEVRYWNPSQGFSLQVYYHRENDKIAGELTTSVRGNTYRALVACESLKN